MQLELLTDIERTVNLADGELKYYPEFIQLHQAYFKRLQKDILWQQDTIQMYGRAVKIPRLNAWYGDPGAAYSYSGIDLIPLVWNNTLLEIKNELERRLNRQFNSVLANLYRDGNDSVAWHSDDEPELGDRPVIASLSFGASRRFSLRHRKDHNQPPLHLDLTSGSLLLMKGDTQSNWQHQIPKTSKPVGPRINLTFRNVISSIKNQPL